MRKYLTILYKNRKFIAITYIIILAILSILEGINAISDWFGFIIGLLTFFGLCYYCTKNDDTNNLDE